MRANKRDKFKFIKPRSQLNTTSTKPLLHGNVHNHATAVFLFSFLPLADIAFEEFRFFKDMYKRPELHIRQLVIIDTQLLAVKRSLQNPEVRVIFPCAGLRQLPLCGLAPGTTLRCKLFPSDKFSEIQLYFFNRIAYNEASEKSESIKLKGERIWN